MRLYEFLYWLVLISRLYDKFWLFLKNCIKISSFFREVNRRLLVHNNIKKTGMLPVLLRDDCDIFHFLICHLLIIYSNYYNNQNKVKCVVGFLQSWIGGSISRLLCVWLTQFCNHTINPGYVFQTCDWSSHQVRTSQKGVL